MRDSHGGLSMRRAECTLEPGVRAKPETTGSRGSANTHLANGTQMFNYGHCIKCKDFNKGSLSCFKAKIMVQDSK